MRSLVALAVAALALTIPVGRARAAASANESTMAREIANDINRERAARGLAAIPFDAGAYSSGAQRVAESNRDRPCHACHSTDHPSGEIVWWGSDYPSSAPTIWWMGSPPHRALVLAPNATKLGVGVACKGTEHDAVAWIETTAAADNPPPTPVATKDGTGSRCKGGSSTPAPSGSATTRPAAAASPGATPTTAAAKRSAVAGAGPATTVGAGRTSTTTGRTTTTKKPTKAAVRRDAVAAAFAGGGGASSSGDARSALEPSIRLDPATGRVIAASSRRVAAGGGGVGGLGSALLLAAFVGALVVGRFTHRTQAVDTPSG